MNRGVRHAAGVALLLIVAGCAGPRALDHPTDNEKMSTASQRAVAFYTDGLFKDMEQNPAAALLSYQEALLYDSTAAEVHLAIAKDYLILGKDELGRRSLKSALRHDVQCVEALEILSDLELRQGNVAEAETAIQAILSLDSLNVDALNSKAYIALRQEQIPETERLVRRVLDQGAEPLAQVLMGLGDYYLQQGDFQKGTELFQKLVDANPWDGLGYFGLGMFQEVQGDTTGAIGQYRQALTVMPVFPEVVARLSQIYMARRQWDEGLRLLHNVVRQDSTDIDAWLGMTPMLQQKGEEDSALTVLRYVEAQFPEDARASYELGQYYLAAERYGEALAAFEEVTRRFPDNPGGWLNAGLCLLFDDRAAESESYFREAVTRLPNHYQPAFYLGTVLSQLGRDAEAIPYLESALNRLPDDAGGPQVLVMSTLASAYDAVARYAEADTLFDEALQLEPDNATVLNNYGYSLCQRDARMDDARRMVEKAVELEPENASFLDSLGWILFKQGDAEGALVYLRKSWAIRPESAEVAEHLGDVYFDLGRQAEARRAWQDGLDLNPDSASLKEKLLRQ